MCKGEGVGVTSYWPGFAAISPVIHPMSSCLWGWGQVVCCPSCGAGAGVIGHGTHPQTTLQAAACRRGGRWQVVPGWWWWWWWPCHGDVAVSTHYPPYEQWLAAVGWVLSWLH